MLFKEGEVLVTSQDVKPSKVMIMSGAGLKSVIYSSKSQPRMDFSYTFKSVLFLNKVMVPCVNWLFRFVE